MNEYLKNFFSNKLSGVATIFGILWWVFPRSLGLYEIIYHDPELQKGDTIWLHLGLGIFFIFMILQFGRGFFPRQKVTRSKFNYFKLK